MAQTRCSCGKVMSKYATACKACEKVASAKRFAEAAEHVKNGCPKCGLPLRRNLALTGWWQCAAFGQAQFRESQYKTAPDCSFQTFTER